MKKKNVKKVADLLSKKDAQVLLIAKSGEDNVNILHGDDMDLGIMIALAMAMDENFLKVIEGAVKAANYALSGVNPD